MKTTGLLLLFLCSVLGIHQVQTKDTTTISTETSVVAVPAAENTVQLLAASVEVIQASPDVLTIKYKFGERSNRVLRLQRTLNRGLRLDGVYGMRTYEAHKAALEAAGASLGVLPGVPVVSVAKQYGIPQSKEMRCPQYEDEIRAAGLEPVEVFSYIAYRESRCRVGAINAIWKNGKIVWTLNKDGSYDSGLLQINSSWKTVVSQVCNSERGNLQVLFDLNCNLKVAKYLMDNSKSGLGNWRVYKSS
jgi:hypothetical protein